MSFFAAVRTCFARYVGFTGRARRSEYWWFALFTVIVGVIAQVLDVSVFDTDPDDPTAMGPVEVVTSLALFLPGLAVGVRRMHDIGKRGGWVLISLIPIIGWILWVVWTCRDSQPHENQYGPSPKPGCMGEHSWPGSHRTGEAPTYSPQQTAYTQDHRSTYGSGGGAL